MRVGELEPPHRLVLDWGDDGATTTVTWTLPPLDDVSTRHEVVESGFVGDEEARLAAALDTTHGFDQFVVAAKALLEHDVVMNVVADHV